jgi:hypothetical protein
MSLQERNARRLATISLAAAGSSVLIFVVGEMFFWNPPDFHAFENVMETGVAFMAISAILGIRAFNRAGPAGSSRPTLVKWTFRLALLFVVLLVALLISALMPMPHL